MRFSSTTIVTALTVALASLTVWETHGLVTPPRLGSSGLSSSSMQRFVATATPPSSAFEAAATEEDKDAVVAAKVLVGEIASSAAESSGRAMDNDNDVDNVEFPPPLSSLDRMKRAATFWSTAIPIVANYYGLIGNLKLKELLGNEMTEADVEVSTKTQV